MTSRHANNNDFLMAKYNAIQLSFKLYLKECRDSRETTPPGAAINRAREPINKQAEENNEIIQHFSVEESIIQWKNRPKCLLLSVPEMTSSFIIEFLNNSAIQLVL